MQSAPAKRIAIHDSHIGTTQSAIWAGQFHINLATWTSAIAPKTAPVIWMYVRMVSAPLDEFGNES
jgi:hypothetical protein